jgi:hypothetical protein
MANTGELLITTVKTTKPKMLTGLTQKGCGPVQGPPTSPATDASSTGE